MHTESKINKSKNRRNRIDVKLRKENINIWINADWFANKKVFATFFRKSPFVSGVNEGEKCLLEEEPRARTYKVDFDQKHLTTRKNSRYYIFPFAARSYSFEA